MGDDRIKATFILVFDLTDFVSKTPRLAPERWKAKHILTPTREPMREVLSRDLVVHDIFKADHLRPMASPIQGERERQHRFLGTSPIQRVDDQCYRNTFHEIQP
jgi:hypothetical protein